MLSGESPIWLVCMGWDSQQACVGTHGKHVYGLTASMCWDSQQAIWCDVVLAGIGDQDTEEHCKERGLHQVEACVCTEGVCPQVSSESNKIKLCVMFMISISNPQMSLLSGVNPMTNSQNCTCHQNSVNCQDQRVYMQMSSTGQSEHCLTVTGRDLHMCRPLHPALLQPLQAHCLHITWCFSQRMAACSRPN